MRILVAEDDSRLRRHLVAALREAGHEVEETGDGTDALRILESRAHDAAVLDISMPGMDGVSVIRKARDHGCRATMLLSTARGEVRDKVAGLDAGADDYLVKPFAFSELLARVRTLFRRTTPSEGNVFKIQDLKIVPVVHKVTRGDQKIELTSQEFNLLLLLARYEGQVLTRTQIMQKIWEIDFEPNTNVVDVAVRRLRMKVDDPFETKLIHTVRGVGYVLEKRA